MTDRRFAPACPNDKAHAKGNTFHETILDFALRSTSKKHPSKKIYLKAGKIPKSFNLLKYVS